jgi:hypothetical protein
MYTQTIHYSPLNPNEVYDLLLAHCFASDIISVSIRFHHEKQVSIGSNNQQTVDALVETIMDKLYVVEEELNPKFYP